MIARRLADRRRSGARGQGLVEFAVLVPVFFLLLLGMLEFGLAYTHDQTLAYATREGARAGAALGVGNSSYPCNTPNFDAPIVAAVERILESPGSPITIANVQSIKIYLANAAGNPTGSVNNWALAIGGGQSWTASPLTSSRRRPAGIPVLGTTVSTRTPLASRFRTPTSSRPRSAGSSSS